MTHATPISHSYQMTFEAYRGTIHDFFIKNSPHIIIPLMTALSKNRIPTEVKKPLLDTCLNLLHTSHGEPLTNAALLLNCSYKLCDSANPSQKESCTSAALQILPRILEEGIQPLNNKSGLFSILTQAPRILEMVPSLYEEPAAIKIRLFDLQLRTAETAVGRLREEPLILLEDATMTAAGDPEKEARLLYTVTNMLPRFISIGGRSISRSADDHRKMVKIVSDLSGIPVASQVPLKANNLFIPRQPLSDQTGERITSYAVCENGLSFEQAVIRRQADSTPMQVLIHNINAANVDAFDGLKKDQVADLDPVTKEEFVKTHERMQREKPANEAIVRRARILFEIRHKFPSPCEALARLMEQKKVNPELLSKFRAEIALHEPSKHP